MTSMHRRNFIFMATGGIAMAALPGAAPANTFSANAQAAGPAAIRIGQRLLTALPWATLEELRHHATTLPAALGPDLQTQISTDHRAGRTIRLDGISLSVTESAWCLMVAENQALT